MINYFKNDKYNLNGEIGKLLDENKKNNIDISKKIGLKNTDVSFSEDHDIEIMFFYGLSIYKNADVMHSITEIYLEKNIFRAKEKVDMLNAMNNVHTSIFHIEKVDPNEGYVYLVDVLTGEKYKIVDEALSIHNRLDNYYLYSRIITIDDISFGNCSILIEKIDQVEKLISLYKKEKFSVYDLSINVYRIAYSNNMLDRCVVNNIS